MLCGVPSVQARLFWEVIETVRAEVPLAGLAGWFFTGKALRGLVPARLVD